MATTARPQAWGEFLSLRPLPEGSVSWDITLSMAYAQALNQMSAWG